MASMKEPLEGKGMMRGRVLYRAWDEDQGRAFGQVVKAVDATIVQFHARAKATLKKAA